MIVMRHLLLRLMLCFNLVQLVEAVAALSSSLEPYFDVRNCVSCGVAVCRCCASSDLRCTCLSQESVRRSLSVHAYGRSYSVPEQAERRDKFETVLPFRGTLSPASERGSMRDSALFDRGWVGSNASQ